MLSDRFGVSVIGVPGTIDNDLSYTDNTIGFDTAINIVLDAITRIRDTSSSHQRTSVVEVMGRHCGDIALYSGITGGAECVLLPEIDEDMEAVYRKVTEGIESGKLHNIIIKAEGFNIDDEELFRTLKERTGRNVNYIKLSYLQRGGSPTFRDRMLATQCGMTAIDLIRHGETNRAIGERDGHIVHYDLTEALEMTRGIDYDLYKGVDVLSM